MEKTGGVKLAAPAVTRAYAYGFLMALMHRDQARVACGEDFILKDGEISRAIVLREPEHVAKAYELGWRDGLAF